MSAGHNRARRLEDIELGQTGTDVLGQQGRLYVGWWTCSCPRCLEEEFRLLMDAYRRSEAEWRQQVLDLDGER